MKTAVSYESVKEWFGKAALRAASQGKSDSATLWRDGLEHLEHLEKQRAELLAACIKAEELLSPFQESGFLGEAALKKVRAAIAKATAAESEGV